MWTAVALKFVKNGSLRISEHEMRNGRYLTLDENPHKPRIYIINVPKMCMNKLIISCNC